LTNNDEICVPCYLRAQRVLGSSQRSSTLVPPSTFRQSDTQPEQQTEVVPSTSGNLIDETSAEQILPATFTDDTAEDDEVSLHITSPPLQVTSAEQITLPTLRRAADTARRCLFLECNDSEKRRVPDGLRKQIIKDFNFYIPRNARSCTFHLGANLFHELYAAENALSTFSAAHIEEIVFLLAEETQLDFQNPENIDDHLFKYWFGRTKAEFNEVLVEVPQLNDAKMKNGFSALLCKMRTGDSDERISTLFKIPRRTLEDHMNKARGILCQYYVPRHLGWAHKPRQEFVARNTALAEHLFGNPETPSEERRLIAIADGTYLSTYQIRQAKSYVGEHLRVHGMYTLEVCQDNAPLQGIFNDSQPSIIRGRIKSRHIGRTRTVGCCSHVMSILWYMGYARHQESISAPATFLDNLLVGIQDILLLGDWDKSICSKSCTTFLSTDSGLSCRMHIDQLVLSLVSNRVEALGILELCCPKVLQF
ncbi:hypothetical protein HW555_013689, partial [Spodoptera exigua]